MQHFEIMWPIIHCTLMVMQSISNVFFLVGYIDAIKKLNLWFKEKYQDDTQLFLKLFKIIYLYLNNLNLPKAI